MFHCVLSTLHEERKDSVRKNMSVCSKKSTGTPRAPMTSQALSPPGSKFREPESAG